MICIPKGCKIKWPYHCLKVTGCLSAQKKLGRPWVPVRFKAILGGYLNPSKKIVSFIWKEYNIYNKIDI